MINSDSWVLNSVTDGYITALVDVDPKYNAALFQAITSSGVVVFNLRNLVVKAKITDLKMRVAGMSAVMATIQGDITLYEALDKLRG